MSSATLARTALLVAIAAGFVFALAIGWQTGWGLGLLCLVGTAALAAASLPFFVRRDNELYEPLWLVVLLVAVGVTGKAFYVCLGPRPRLDYILLDKQPADLLFAAVVLTAALLCLSAGYLLGGVRWRLPGAARLAVERWHRHRFLGATGILVTIGLLSFVIFARDLNTAFDSLLALSSKRAVRLESGESYLGSGYLRWGALLIEIGFYLFFVRRMGGRRRLGPLDGAAVALIGLLALAFPFFVSSRATVIIFITRVILVFLIVRGNVRLRYVLVAMLAGLLLIGSMLSLRRRQPEWRSLQAHMGVGGLLEITVGSRHFFDLAKTAHMLDAVPDRLDYQYGATMVSWIVAPVPRAWWPEKPIIGAGLHVAEPAFEKLPGTGGVPPGLVGELYLNFGYGGIFIGMLGIGLALRSLYETLRPGFPAPAYVLIYTVLSTRLAVGFLSSSVSGAMSKLLQEMVPLLLALYLMGRPPRAETEESSP